MARSREQKNNSTDARVNPSDYISGEHRRMRGAALAYAKRGIHVFPCWPGTKEPLTANGFKDATTDEVKVASWWSRNPAANVAAATGKASGFFVLDVDPKSGGFESLEEWEVSEPMPETWLVRTPGGGLHYYFAYPNDGTEVPCSVAKIAPGLDVRGDGGYVLLPPSTLNGEEYADA